MNISSGGSNSQDFDLNLAPIIDAFVVLIAYLLVSASFLSLTVLDVGVSASGEASAQEEQAPADPPFNMEILLTAAKNIEIKVSGGPQNIEIATQVQALEAGQGAAGAVSWDVERLKKAIAKAQKRWPSIADVSVSADPGVKYRDMVKVIEALKKQMPKIYISG